LSEEAKEQELEAARVADEDAGRGRKLRRPWRWALGAVSIAAVGAGIFFISKKGAIRRSDAIPPDDEP
jgi:hypothetical protein